MSCQALVLLLAVFLTAWPHSAVCETVDSVDVSIEVSYSAPEDFSLQAPYYRAASALTLSCVVAEDNGGLFYQWTSTCQGSCFVQGASSQRVSTHALHSRDSGVHTCTVYDGLGCTGNASITVQVSGVGIYVTDGHKVLSNNDIITAPYYRSRLSNFHCISATEQSNVGGLIGPGGYDVTYSTYDPFLVTFSGSHDPGVLRIRGHSAIDSYDNGIYTCRIPNGFNTVVDFNVGIYQYYYLSNNGGPQVTSLTHNVEQHPYTVTCISTKSPPTSVIWTKDGDVLAEDVIHKFSQTLVNRRASTYRNEITMDVNFAVTVAEYSCTIRNSFGLSNTLQTSIKALEVTGHEAPLIVGLSGELTCSTHLDVAKLEWYLVGFEDSLEEADNTTLSIDVDVYSTALDGNEFTCRGTTVGGMVFEQTVTIVVKELEHVVEIEAPPNPVQPGREVQLTCVVTSDIAPQVSWVVTTDNVTNLGDVFIGEPVVEGNTTTLVLSIGTLKTSHGREYSCLSFVQNPASFKSDIWNVIVQIPTPEVSLNQTPANAVLYTTSNVVLTCAVEVDETVDTAVNVSVTWSGPALDSSSSRVAISESSESNLQYSSHLTISSLMSLDSGAYLCEVIVDSSESSFVASSDSYSEITEIEAVLRVEVEVSYTAPDQYPTYQPPEYRTASAVSLRCVAHGTSGYVSYSWSSTCSSPCFAYSSSSQTISRDFLRWYDAGVHTCTVSDALGNSGSNSTEMKVVGAGIYLTYNYSQSGLNTEQPIANNSMLLVYTGSYSSSSIRLSLWCCSNSSASSIGSFVFPSGNVYSSYAGWYMYIARQSGWSNTYAGCIQFYISRSRYSYYSLPYNGVYTCMIPDASGNMLNVDFGLYPKGYSYGPESVTLHRETTTTPSRSNATFTLSCRSQSYPATNVTWTRNGLPVLIDQETTRVQSNLDRTSRSSANYNTTFMSSEDPDELVGTYNCTAGNQFGSVNSSEIEVTGIEVSYSTPLVVSQTALFNCWSDLEIQQIEWFADGVLVASTYSNTSQYQLYSISTDHQDSLYTCVAISPYGNQERIITLSVTVPDYWAWVDIREFPQGARPLNATSFTLTCTVHGITGMHLPAIIEWVDSDGSVMTSSQRITVGEEVSVGTDTTLSLTFDPVYNEDGGLYSCRASVDVPWMTQQPPVASATKDLEVLTEAFIQLKMGPLPNCLNWEGNHPDSLNHYIMEAIGQAVRERCDCNFWEYESIEGGEFSCLTTLTSNKMVYRAKVIGTSGLLTASQIVAHIEDWRESEGSFLYNRLRIKLEQESECPLHISSFHDMECDTGNGDLDDQI